MKRTRIVIYHHPFNHICMITHTGKLKQNISLDDLIAYLRDWADEMGNDKT